MKTTLLFAVFWTSLTGAFCQTFDQASGLLTIDLSQSQQNLKIRFPKNKPIRIKIVNLLPFNKYSFIAERSANRIPPLDVNNFTVPQGLSQDQCTQDLKVLIFDKTYKSKTEAELGQNLSDLYEKVKGCGGIDAITDNTIKQELIRLPGLTQREFALGELDFSNVNSLKSGEKVSLKIIREPNTTLSIEKKDFEVFEISTDSKGNWEMNYGFSFKGNILSNNKEYFAKSDTGNTYLITESRKLKGLSSLNVYPTVFVTYYPKHRELSSAFIGFTTGLGTNLDEVSVFVAPSLIIEQNVLLSVGLSFSKSFVLRGDYEPNQRIKENLNFDQLHTGRYSPDVFFSISYRFNKNPFKKSSEEDEE